MKPFITKTNMFVILMMAVFPAYMNAQINAQANPYSRSINTSVSSIPLGRTTVSSFELGNNGSDPIPAGGATWNISFPKNVTVDQSSFYMDGGENIFSADWTIFEGVTYLSLNVKSPGIPAKVFQGPKTKFLMTVNLLGSTVSAFAQQTMNNSFDASISQNLNTGDDNANGAISVVTAVQVQLYPNPAKDIVQITGASPRNDIMLYDIVGNLLLSKKTSGTGADELNMSKYPDGVYVIKITDGLTSSILKLIKQ